MSKEDILHCIHKKEVFFMFPLQLALFEEADNL